MTKHESSPDVVVVGAGIIGCAIALSLQRRGFRTLTVDRGPAAGYGSTSYSAAIVRPYYSTTDGTALAMEGHFAWKNWESYLGYLPATPIQYHECGCLILGTSDRESLVKTRALLSRVGVPFEDVSENSLGRWLPEADLRSFAPPRRIDDPAFGDTDGSMVSGGVFCPTGGYINDPSLACQQIALAVGRAGGRFIYGDPVVAIHSDIDGIQGITLERHGYISCPIVVNAAGPHSAQVRAMAGAYREGEVKTTALRQEVAHLPMPQNSGSAALQCVLTDTDCGVYMRPEGASHMLVGSLEPPCDVLEYVAPDNYQESLSDQWTNQVWRTALRFPGLGIPNSASGYAALYDVSDDWIPIYDITDIKGFFLAIGTSGNQFKNAPLVGEILASIIQYQNSGRNHDATPAEYILPTLSRPIDLRCFSRRRETNRESSFSVLG